MAQGAKKIAQSRDGEDENERYRRDVAERIRLSLDQYNLGLPPSAKMSQADLGKLVAEALGRADPFPQATVSRWMSENNPNTPDNLTARAIAGALNVDLMWLLYGAATD